MELEYGSVKVNSDELKAKAEDAFKKITKYQNSLQEISATVAASESYWDGQAADAYRNILKSQMKIIEDVLTQYAEYPKTLLEFAGIYSETITKAETQVEELQTLELL